MANRRRDEQKRSTMLIDRRSSYQGEEILQSYVHGRYSYDEATGLFWMIERETRDEFLARFYRSETDDSVIIVERRKNVVRSYKHGGDQQHPITLGVGSPEFQLLEQKLRFPQLLTQPYRWAS